MRAKGRKGCEWRVRAFSQSSRDQDGRPLSPQRPDCGESPGQLSRRASIAAVRWRYRGTADAPIVTAELFDAEAVREIGGRRKEVGHREAAPQPGLRRLRRGVGLGGRGANRRRRDRPRCLQMRSRCPGSGHPVVPSSGRRRRRRRVFEHGQGGAHGVVLRPVLAPAQRGTGADGHRLAHQRGIVLQSDHSRESSVPDRDAQRQDRGAVIVDRACLCRPVRQGLRRPPASGARNVRHRLEGANRGDQTSQTHLRGATERRRRTREPYPQRRPDDDHRDAQGRLPGAIEEPESQPDTNQAGNDRHDGIGPDWHVPRLHRADNDPAQPRPRAPAPPAGVHAA